MIYRNAIMLVTLAVSSNAFFWGNDNRELEPQPSVKQVPVGYFRTFTYIPSGFNPQTSNQYYSYPGGKMLQPNPIYHYQKSFNAQPGLQSSVYGQNPSQNMPSAPNTQNVPSPITPTNSVPAPSATTTQSQHTSSHSSSVQPSTYSTNSSPTMATQQSHPSNEIQPPSTVPAQFTSNPQHLANNLPIRQIPYVPDPVNLQYLTNVAPVPLQHVQFVPCMCPVAVSVSTAMTPDIIANKRSDEIQMSDYRESPIDEQSIGLSEER